MSNRIYFDNAATTPLDPEVLEAMMPYLTNHYGNPSSIYSYGRETRLAIENARKSVAAILHAHPSEIFFTSGGTESSNTAIFSAIRDLGFTRIISSPIEHHATLHTVQWLAQKGEVELKFCEMNANGELDINSLEALLDSNERAFVSLMHANNEIGTMIDLHEVGSICKKHHALFHSDTVQTVGHFPFNLGETNVDFITGSGHKFHGPKGVGILYINRSVKISPLLHGGSQERNMRAGTENVYGIVGFAKALEIASRRYEEDRTYIAELKGYMMAQLKNNIEGVTFNGTNSDLSLYTVLSVNFPFNDRSEMILFNLDIHNICVSGGSACSSGTNIGSHVIEALNPGKPLVTVRFSFSKYNTKQEIDQVISTIKGIV